jgi:hypothetical protein
MKAKEIPTAVKVFKIEQKKDNNKLKSATSF